MTGPVGWHLVNAAPAGQVHVPPSPRDPGCARYHPLCAYLAGAREEARAAAEDCDTEAEIVITCSGLLRRIRALATAAGLRRGAELCRARAADGPRLPGESVALTTRERPPTPP